MENVILNFLNILIFFYLFLLLFWSRQCQTQYPKIFRLLHTIGIDNQTWTMFDDSLGFCEKSFFRIYFKNGTHKDLSFYDPPNSHKKSFFYASYSEAFANQPWLATGIIEYLYSLYEDQEDKIESIGFLTEPYYIDPLNEYDQALNIEEYQSIVDSRKA